MAQLIADAHERVAQTLAAKRATLDALARLLLEREVVERPMLDELLAAGAAGEGGERAFRVSVG